MSKSLRNPFFKIFALIDMENMSASDQHSRAVLIEEVHSEIQFQPIPQTYIACKPVAFRSSKASYGDLWQSVALIDHQ